MPTACIRIVANLGNRSFHFITKFYPGYNVHTYYSIGYYFYTLLVTLTDDYQYVIQKSQSRDRHQF